MRLEKDIVKSVRTALQALKTTLFRNQVGAYKVSAKQWIKYGLCVGSSDFIGWLEYIIEPKDVGRKLAVFTAIETKRPKGGKHTKEQIDFVAATLRAGGIAGFVRSAQEAEKLINEFKQQREVHHDIRTP